MSDKRHVDLEITYRDGRPRLGYLYLSDPGEKASSLVASLRRSLSTSMSTMSSSESSSWTQKTRLSMLSTMFSSNTVWSRSKDPT